MFTVMAKKIDLTNVIQDKDTILLFEVARRSDKPNELTFTDALSWVMYEDRMSTCGNDEMCLDKISRWDMRNLPYAEETVDRWFATYSWRKSNTIFKRALTFMRKADMLIETKSAEK